MIERSIELFRPHHNELRKRLVRVFLSIAVCTGVAYFFSEQIAGHVMDPLFGASPLVEKLVYTNLPEAFLSYLKLSLMVGIAASFPVALYQLWMFISPGLRKNEKKMAVITVFWGSLLFLGGVAFAYFVVLPKMLSYFMSYANPGLTPLPKLGKYLTFVIRTSITMGLAFQIPFLMVMAGKASLVKPIYFRQKRWYFYIAIVIVSFLLSAGDFMATALLSLPLFGLYEAGILLSTIFGKNKTSSAEKEQETDAATESED